MLTQMTMKVTTEEFAAQNDFFAWAVERGIQFPRIEPGNFGDLRGIKARVPIYAGDMLVEFPLSAVLCVGDSQPCPIPEWVDTRFWYVSSLHTRLAVLLLYEAGKGAASDYFPWIQAMPLDHSDKLARWSDEELQELHDDALAREARRQRELIDDAYQTLARMSPSTPASLDAFRW